MQELEVLANGGNRASVVSADGTVIAGFAQGSFSRTPAVWSSDTSGQLLDPPNGDALGEVHGISDDGTKLLVEWNGDATIFDEKLNPTTIGAGSLNPGWDGNPLDIADDGTVVGFDNLSLNRVAWIQPGGVGPIQDLKTWAEAGGASVPTELDVCQAISTDGTKMIGHTGPFFATAWIITLEPDCIADLADGDGSVGFQDLLVLLASWGRSDVAADLDGDGLVGFNDLLILLASWGPCAA
jgi:hypothetical protein